MSNDPISGRFDAKGKKICIIVSRWNEMITNALLEGARDTLASYSADDVTVIHVPGAWEIPVAARNCLNSMGPAAIVSLGCILQGATPHAGMLARDVSQALMRLQLETGVPITWGVLTPHDDQQAMDRAGLKLGNKGREAAQSAVEMISVVEQIKSRGSA